MYKPTRRQFLGTTAAAIGLGMTGASGAARAAAPRSLTLYNGQHAQTTAAVVEAFTRATGIEVKVRKGSSSQLANQIIEEGDLSPADLFYSEESPPLAALAEQGALAKLDDATLKSVPAAYAAPDGTWVGASARCRVVAYDTARLKEADLPPSVLDFATEAWKDRVAYVPTSGAFLQQIVAIEQLRGREAALEWLKGLKRYGRAYNGNKAAMQAVENGEIETALVNNYYWYAVAAEVGEANMKSALYYVGRDDPGALVTVSAVGIVESSRNIEDAQAFVAFMLSAEGQKAIVGSVAEYPLRADVTSPYDLKPFDEVGNPAVTPASLGDAADALVLEREAGLA